MKARSPLSPHRALTAIGERIGWPRAARLVRRSVRTCQHWSDPDTGGMIRLDDALLLDLAYVEAGGALPPLLTWYRTAFFLAAADRGLALESASAEAIARVAIESGEATAALALAHQPNATPAQRRAAKRESWEAIEAFIHAMAPLAPPPEVAHG